MIKRNYKKKTTLKPKLKTKGGFIAKKAVGKVVKRAVEITLSQAVGKVMEMSQAEKVDFAKRSLKSGLDLATKLKSKGASRVINETLKPTGDQMTYGSCHGMLSDVDTRNGIVSKDFKIKWVRAMGNPKNTFMASMKKANGTQKSYITDFETFPSSEAFCGAGEKAIVFPAANSTGSAAEKEDFHYPFTFNHFDLKSWFIKIFGPSPWTLLSTFFPADLGGESDISLPVSKVIVSTTLTNKNPTQPVNITAYLLRHKQDILNESNVCPPFLWLGARNNQNTRGNHMNPEYVYENYLLSKNWTEADGAVKEYQNYRYTAVHPQSTPFMSRDFKRNYDVSDVQKISLDPLSRCTFEMEKIFHDGWSYQDYLSVWDRQTQAPDRFKNLSSYEYQGRRDDYSMMFTFQGGDTTLYKFVKSVDPVDDSVEYGVTRPQSNACVLGISYNKAVVSHFANSLITNTFELGTNPPWFDQRSDFARITKSRDLPENGSRIPWGSINMGGSQNAPGLWVPQVLSDASVSQQKKL